jgi:hypothetical protein
MNRSSKSDLPLHWRFALGQAFAAIERLVWTFDFEAEAGEHSYASVPAPDDIIRIIEGFLTEHDLIYAGDVDNLKRLLEITKQQIAPAYRAGQEAAVERWQRSTPDERASFTNTLPEEVRKSVQLIAPVEKREANWFFQGYCRRWTEEAFQHVVRDTGNQ